MARAMGFEPTISSVTGRRFKPLSYARLLWLREGSNLRTWPYEDPALATELRSPLPKIYLLRGRELNPDLKVMGLA